MPQPQRQHPLEIPEILSQVAHFLPLWIHKESFVRPLLAFEPKTIMACLLVNKLWYATFSEILWYIYDGSFHERAPLELVHRKCHLFRIFRSHRGHEGPYTGCVNLLELYISQQSLSQWTNGVDLQCQMDLVRANHGLKALYWHGPAQKERAPLPVKSLTGFRNMQYLRLLAWDGSDGRLAKVLRSVAETVTKVGLYSIMGVKPGDFLFEEEDGDDDNEDEYDGGDKDNEDEDDDMDNGDKDEDEGEGKETETETGGALAKGKKKKKKKKAATSPPSFWSSRQEFRTKQLILPNLVNLGYRINNTESMGMEDLVMCCPNLYKLSIIPEYEAKFYDLPRLTRNIKDHCHNLRVLTAKYSSLQEHEYISLLDCCRPQGLVKLKLTMKNITVRTADAIIAHAQTLEVLELPGFLEPMPFRILCRIMVACPNLRVAAFSGYAPGNRQKFLNELWAQPWGCPKLKVFGISFEEDETDPDNQYFLDLERIPEREDNTEPLQDIMPGWYLHPQVDRYRDEKASKQNRLFVFAMLSKLEEMPDLEMVSWCGVKYERSPIQKYGFQNR
ncbi:hypothetical protein BGZ79_010236 [Entomortierella chlamydospora]|nr:hypothetical protein BGZ79_010236 [Entomortierella chlamydospora]